MKCNFCKYVFKDDDETENTEAGNFCVDGCLEKAREADDRCSECGGVIDNEDYYGHNEVEEYWGANVNRHVTDGYYCHHCGHREDY